MKIFGKELHQKKIYIDGTHRSQSPAETLQQYIPLMNMMGITRLADVTGLDHIGLPVYASIVPNSKILSTYNGKGKDRESAKASALMEAIEYYHIEHIEKPLLHGSYRELCKKWAVINPNTIFGIAMRASIDSPLLWIEGENLLSGHPAWIPYVSSPMDSISLMNIGDSNGLASGNHILEALVHGLCEVVERDAIAYYFLSPEEDRKVRLETIGSGSLRTVLDLLERAKILIGIADATFDTGIPTYACMICDPPDCPMPMGYFWGFGSHLDPEIAALRAVTEAVQCRLTEITGTREDINMEEYGRCRNREELEEIEQLLKMPPPALDFQEKTNFATDTFEGDLQEILSRLERIGVEGVYAIDLTKEEFNVPVVKTFISSLEGPFETNYQPGPRIRAKLAEQNT